MARLDSTTVPESVAVAQTSRLLLLLIELTNVWIEAPAATGTSLPSIVTVSAWLGGVYVNVRCAEVASWVTAT